MTIFFNLEILERKTGADASKVVKLLGYMDGLKKPSFYLGGIKELQGFSFLTNAKPLCANLEIHDPNFVLQYVRLAARRNYSEYKQYNVTYLNTSFYPELAVDAIKANPLITIKSDKIYFKYEEIYNGIKIRRHQG